MTGTSASGGDSSSSVHVPPAVESDPLLDKSKPIHAPPAREFNIIAFYFVICVVGFVQGPCPSPSLLLPLIFPSFPLLSGSSNLSKLATEYFFKDDVHFSPAQLSVAGGLIGAPWVIKPVYGFISDSYPILGRRRTPYFLIFGLTGFGFYMIMAYLVHQAVRMCLALSPVSIYLCPAHSYLLVSRVYCMCVCCGAIYAIPLYPPSTTSTSSCTAAAVLTLFGASLSICFCNVLAEALIVERGKSEQAHVDPNTIKNKVTWYMTVFWGTESFTKIFSGYFSGQLLEIYSKQTIFIITSIAPLFLVVLAFAIQEPPRTEEQPTVWCGV